jgi:hypothetical protein
MRLRKNPQFTTTAGSLPGRSLMKRLALAACLAAAGMVVSACVSSPGIQPSRSSPGPLVSVSRGCAHFHRHQYEVCYAYVVNDTWLARVEYYKFGRDPVLGPPALTRLKSRFYGAAQRFVIGQARVWPRHVDVSVPRIRIVGRVAVSANLATATLHTIETWLVRAQAGSGGKPGRVLFAETKMHHTITLDRTPTMLCLAGHCLHKWVVVRIQ